MSDYFWDNQIEYLRKTRELYYNDDYLEFLIDRVWKFTTPINIIDFGCGYGFLGLKLLPMLPAGSTYTGIDLGIELINRAKEIFQHTSFQTQFIQGDIGTMHVERKYDVAICHAFLLHMVEPEKTIKKMINSVCDQGKVICFEPHWISNMSNYFFDGIDQSQIIKLGILQKLYEEDFKRLGKSGNFGMQVPVILSKLGLTDVECRISDKVNFLDQNMQTTQIEQLYLSLREEGLGQQPGDRNEIIQSLINKGLTDDEACAQYDAELTFSKEFGNQSWLTYSLNMKISFGTVRLEGSSK
ncbi:class I SAM-dependent methyltransferase [Paenibacillus sp. 1001270B_150601_E10]|uniref:class I SAM-dependent methyltransferase n=1 Tax=Paenibacillus sp. 1001270B_150601_E10 TaxID=2787079 RepID=UPI00189C6FC1|nr:class I SAM-dependent methyltransferase [Paenibacillus sp. 1001270B_150601_E10]